MFKNKGLAVFGVLVLLVVGAILTLSMVSPGYFKGPYSVVSTPAGFYVARLSYPMFSSFVALKDAFILTDVANEQNEVVDQQLIPVSQNTIWAPSIIYLNESQILFKGLVGECSAIDRTLRKDNDCPALQTNNPVPPATNTPTATPTQ